MVSNQDKISAFKLAQLVSVAGTYHIEIIENILSKEGDINYAIPVDNPIRPSIAGCTALHIASMRRNIGMLVSLLNQGADFTKKNKDGCTALHLLITEKKKYITESINDPLINAILSAHVDTNNFSNPCNKDGLSHFHIACMANHLRAVGFFLANDVSVDEPVSKVSTFSPGFTPLHFAAMCSNNKIAELIVGHGANMHIEDAKGITTLELLIEHKLHMFNSIGAAIAICKEGDCYEILQEKIDKNDKIINMLMENMSIDNDCSDKIGLTNFHVACILQDISAAQHLVDQVADLDHCINMDSPLWPGYTALHFAAHVSIKTVEFLINNGANIEVKDLRGLTALDICTERYKIEDICGIMSLNVKYENTLFSDGHTELLSLIRTLSNRDQFIQFMILQNINMCIPMESSLWPGYTPLHFVVLFAERSKRIFYEDRAAKERMDTQMIKFCFKIGANLNGQDSQGRTALHLAFRLNKMTLVDLILQYCPQIPNLSDEDNLSHLHIACATKKKNKLKKCVLNNVVVNSVYKGTLAINTVRPGSTPLHVCLANSEDKDDLKHKIKILLGNGADPSIKDIYGLTPIHRILECYSDCLCGHYVKQLLTKVSHDCVAEEYGLSYLHVACLLKNNAAIKRLIKNGANVNLAIEYTQRGDDDPLIFLSRYDKYTPLHMFTFSFTGTHEPLLKHGADVFAKEANGITPLNNSLILHDFLDKLRNKIDLKNRMRREFGWTKVHLACFTLEVDGFEDVLRAEPADINAQIFINSPVWKGYTPLHLLMHRVYHNSSTHEKSYSMAKILLENGADVTAMDQQRDTPLSMIFKAYMSKEALNLATMLIKYHRDFSVNPVNAEGISHFHIVCYLSDVAAVQGFLSCGVDVNRPIDFFAKWCPGCTPLHLASQLEVVNLLINHGADILTETVNGCSVLAEALKHEAFDENVITKLIECGAAINSLNFHGQRPFEIAVLKHQMTMEKLVFCINQGFIVNSCNPISGSGYIATILANFYQNKTLQMLIVERIMNENSTNALGRTTLHHIVSGCIAYSSINVYVGLFKKLIKSGHDIDEQDNEGRTALHLAVQFVNETAVSALLASGADINILDINGEPAFSCISRQTGLVNYGGDSKNIRNLLSLHMCQLAYLKLELKKINLHTISNAQKTIYSYTNYRDFFTAIAASKRIELGVRSLRLYDFLKETGAVTMYRSLSLSERSRIDQYFESIDNNTSIKEIKNVLKYQHAKAVKRFALFFSATESFRLLLDFDLPDLCANSIFQYLSNYDLININSAALAHIAEKMSAN